MVVLLLLERICDRLERRAIAKLYALLNVPMNLPPLARSLLLADSGLARVVLVEMPGLLRCNVLVGPVTSFSTAA